MDAAIKSIQIIRAALIICIAFYLFVGEEVSRRTSGLASQTLYFAFTAFAISTIVAIVVLRRVMVLRAEKGLATQPLNSVLLQRWRAGYIFTYALSEAVALYGLVLRLTGFTLSQVLPFYAVSLILMIFFSPRRPINQIE